MMLIMLCFSEIGSKITVTGGAYAYIHAAFGPYAGFLANTMFWFVGILADAAIANAMANILPINGLNTGQVSALYPNLFVPDGFTFSIWSVIYTWLLLFVIISSSWLLSSKATAAQRSAAAQLSPLFIISGIINVSWILAWHYLQVWLSLGLMLVLLTLLFLQEFHEFQLLLKELVSGYQAAEIVDWVSTRH